MKTSLILQSVTMLTILLDFPTQQWEAVLIREVGTVFGGRKTGSWPPGTGSWFPGTGIVFGSDIQEPKMRALELRI